MIIWFFYKIEICSFCRMLKREAKRENGILQISMKSVYFCSFSQSYSVVLSFRDLLSVTRKKLKSQIPTIRVKLKVKKAKTIYLSFDNDEVIDIVLQLYMSSKSQSNREFNNLKTNIPGFRVSWDVYN